MALDCYTRATSGRHLTFETVPALALSDARAYPQKQLCGSVNKQTDLSTKHLRKVALPVKSRVLSETFSEHKQQTFSRLERFPCFSPRFLFETVTSVLLANAAEVYEFKIERCFLQENLFWIRTKFSGMHFVQCSKKIMPEHNFRVKIRWEFSWCKSEF